MLIYDKIQIMPDGRVATFKRIEERRRKKDEEIYRKTNL